MEPLADTAAAPRAATGRGAQSLHDLPFPRIEALLPADGVNVAHAGALWRALYRDGAPSIGQGACLSPPLQRWLDRRLGAGGGLRTESPEVVADTRSADGLARKFLLRLDDGQTIETVVMGYPGRFTVCVSTQAGCAMGCVFCATGQMGFARHLRPGEIVAQVLHARAALARDGLRGLRNLVLMGMGEPLHNYDAVMTALEIITDRRGLNIGPARVTISTVGVVPAIVRLAGERRPFRLAVSLHGTSDAERNALVPAGRRWPLAELIAACREYGTRTGMRIFFEWTLIAGTNDSPAHAQRLAALLAGLDAHVNLIPLNPTDGYAGAATSAAAADEFQRVLRAAGLPSTVRQRRGIDVAAGCGQLRAVKARAAAKPE
jgi:23S rRNA (adenine2503-C2)-methyltransferase